MKFDAWTLLLQAINVGLLLWLLQRFLYKPINDLIVERQRAAAQLNAEAQAASARVETERDALANERARLAAGREQQLAESLGVAQQQRDAMLAAAAAEVARRTQAASDALAQERQTAVESLQSETAALAVAVARRLLERLPSGALLELFLDDACAQLQALPGSERAALGAVGSTPLAVELLTPTALDDEARQRCRQRLRSALEREVDCEFCVDEELLAGIELRFKYLRIRNHWAADLERVRRELIADEHTPPSA
jgi:F-type H+-transporting ATPase subunit b